MSERYYERKHQPLHFDHLVLSLWKQAHMITEMREGRNYAIAPDSLMKIKAARKMLSDIIERERARSVRHQ